MSKTQAQRAEDELAKWQSYSKTIRQTWMTRSGLRADVVATKAGYFGELAGFPRNLPAGWSGLTHWDSNGTHVLSRTDDLIRRL